MKTKLAVLDSFISFIGIFYILFCLYYFTIMPNLIGAIFLVAITIILAPKNFIKELGKIFNNSAIMSILYVIIFLVVFAYITWLWVNPATIWLIKSYPELWFGLFIYAYGAMTLCIEVYRAMTE